MIGQDVILQAESLNKTGLLGGNGKQLDKLAPPYTFLECSGEYEQYAFFEITAANRSYANPVLQNTDFHSATYPVKEYIKAIYLTLLI